MSKEAIAIKALEALARLGNGDQYGNSTGNVIARTALFEIAEQPAQPLTDEEKSKLFDSLIDEMLEHSYQGSHDSAEKAANELRRMYKAAHGITSGEATKKGKHMTKQTEAMKLALEALTKNSDRVTEIRAKDQAITALREALAEQPAQKEPVAWMNAKRDMTYLHGPYNADDIPLYTSPPAQRKPLTDEELRVIENKINPNMRWRSSDEEGITLYPIEYYELVLAIEAAHNIKENT